MRHSLCCVKCAQAGQDEVRWCVREREGEWGLGEREKDRKRKIEIEGKVANI